MTHIACISDVAEVVRGVTYDRDSVRTTPAAGYLPILRAGNIRDQLSIDEDLVWVPDALVSERQILRPNDLVMCTSSGSVDVVGKTALFEQTDWLGSYGAFCAVIRPNPSKCVPPFLKHLLRSKSFLIWARSSLGANIKNIRKSELEQFQFSLPPIKEQTRIAAILDKADSLRRKRQEAIHLSEEFLRATFFQLFGDPVANSKRWPERAIVDVATVMTGNTPSREEASYFGSAIEWIKSDNINTPSHLLTRAREGLSERGTSIARIVPAGSTLMTCIAGSPACIGNVAMSDRRVAFNQQINAMTPREGVTPEFLYGLLLFSKARIQAVSTNSMKGMVSKGVLEKVQLIWPPADLQEKFAKVFKQVQRIRSHMETAETSSLTDALQSRLFA